MGAVYIAEQITTGKLRALKLMHPQLVADAKQRERFEQEARVGALIPSDHVVQVIGAGIDQASGAPWLAMELLDGQDLAAHINEHGPFSVADTRAIFVQICHGLGAAHSVGVVHRDVKPENIFLARAKSASDPMAVRILDFGIAKVAAEAKTMATAALGTPLWMAPEQTDPRARITPAADVWSLGLIAFAMLTGRVYWKAASDPMAAMTALMREMLFEPIGPASLRAAELGFEGSLPVGFDAWFARCLEREPAARFQSASEAMEALGPALSSAPRAITAAGAYAGASPAEIAYAPTNPVSSLGNAPAPLAQMASSTTSGVARAAATAGAPAGMTAPAELAPRQKRRGPVVAVAGAAVGAAIAAFVMSRAPADAPAAQRDGDRASAAAEGPGVRPMKADVTPAPDGTGAAAPSSSPSSSTAPAAPSGAALKGAASAAPQTKPASTAKPAAAPRPFDIRAAMKSMQESSNRAKFFCKNQTGPRAIPMTVFFAPTGAVQRISIPADIAGTPSALCARSQLNMSRAPEFDGNKLEPIDTTVALP
jgi:tRNA A-37 threonylcarbamoyl transferase component Bud32